MADSGDWIVPRLNGEPFLEKPPLYWWTLALPAMARSAAFRPETPGSDGRRLLTLYVCEVECTHCRCGTLRSLVGFYVA